MTFEYPYWSTPLAQQTSLVHIAVVLAILSLTAAIWLSYRDRSLWRLYVFIGSGLCVLYEPLGDVLTAVAYPPGDGEMRLFATYGRTIPLWMLPNYFFFISAPLFLITRYLIVRFVSARTWILTFLGIALFMALFEQPGIKSDAWRYYASNGPFAWNTYPVWVAFANAQSALVVATAVYLLRQFILRGWLQIGIIFLLPMIFAASHVSVSLIESAAQYSNAPPLAVNAAAVIAIAASFSNGMICWKVLQLTQRSPAKAAA
ncbi:MAG TPA: hypothetical protein VJQ47_13245 [Steroidobacteraceae bacterium]|nr:hypothetical protein [Steroidobacteraceae bacterium]